MNYDVIVNDYYLFDADLTGLIFSIVIFAFVVSVLKYCSETIKVIPSKFHELKGDELNIAMMEYSNNKVPPYHRYSRWIFTVIGILCSISELHYALLSMTILKGTYSGIEFYSDYLLTSIAIYILLFIIWKIKTKNDENGLKKKYNTDNIYCALVIDKKSNNEVYVKNAYKEFDMLYVLNIASLIVVSISVILKAICYLAFENIINLIPYINFIK